MDAVLQIVAALVGGAVVTFIADIPILQKWLRWYRYMLPPAIILFAWMVSMKDGDYDLSDRIFWGGLSAHLVTSMVLGSSRKERYLKRRRWGIPLKPLPEKNTTVKSDDMLPSSTDGRTMYDCLSDLQREFFPWWSRLRRW